jgi:hypothetical protein
LALADATQRDRVAQTRILMVGGFDLFRTSEHNDDSRSVVTWELNMRALPRLLAGLIVSITLAVPAFGLETFADEAKAQQHCPKDTVVWLNLPTMLWHYKGQR